MGLRTTAFVLAASWLVSLAVGPSAQAFEFTTYDTSGGGHVAGAVSGDQTNSLIFHATGESGFDLSCEKAHWTAELATGTDSQLALTPEFSGCSVIKYGEPYEAEFVPNGCTLVIHIDSKLSAGMFEAHGSVTCPAGKKIEIIDKTGCIDRIGAVDSKGNPVNQNLKTIDVVNTSYESLEHIEVNFFVGSLFNETNGGLLVCGVSKGDHPSGSLEGRNTLKAFNSEKQVDLTVM